jgi:hypothetical protein
MVADVSIVGRANCVATRRVLLSLMQAFVELAECAPEAVVFMRGRTFARTQD